VSGRVAVIGATGFIGWHTCEWFRDAGWSVVGVTRPDRQRPLPVGVDRAAAPLEVRALERACAGASVVVHAAGLTRADSAAAYRLVNVEGTRAVAEATRASGARLIHISSLAAGGPAPAERPLTEAAAPAPITPYGQSKLESERVVAGTVGLRWTTLRPAAVYGPRDRQFLSLFRAVRRGPMPRPANADAYSITMAYVGDVARAIQMACASQGVDGEVFFVGHPSAISLSALMQILAKTLARPYRAYPSRGRVAPRRWNESRAVPRADLTGIRMQRRESRTPAWLSRRRRPGCGTGGNGELVCREWVDHAIASWSLEPEIRINPDGQPWRARRRS
jgi:nucleoside-diphosphate-sugar epimerase